VKVQPNAPCPCGQGTKFKKCCRPLHRGAVAATPEQLMRSRFAAYAVGEAEYIVATTDPDGPQFQQDRERWLEDLRGFCASTSFDGLEVFAAEGTWVSFRATLSQDARDVSFSERSTFRRVEGRWLYHSGVGG
jgi:SEC-C motif-containing protein